MKNMKKVIVSLVAALVLSTSVGHAQGLKYTIKTYFNSGNTYNTVKYGMNPAKYLFKVIGFNPIFDWNTNDTENNNEKPETPEKPEKPVEGPGTPEKPEEPKTPVEEPETPARPEKPTKPQPNPEEPVKPVDPGNNANNSIEQEVARLVNIERQKAGLAPLSLSTELSNVAREKSQDMANKNYFSHTSPTYGDPFEMMRSFGIKYGYAGENIAKGYNSAESVMNGWMNSSGHRANILNPNFKTIGVGYVKSNGTTYWTQMFTD